MRAGPGVLCPGSHGESHPRPLIQWVGQEYYYFLNLPDLQRRVWSPGVHGANPC